MKKLKFYCFFIFSLVLFFSTKINAQAFFGYRGGINLFSTPKQDNDITNGKSIGLNIGVYIEARLRPKLALQSEVKIIQKGFQRKISNSHNFQYKINYLETSCLMKYRILKPKRNMKIQIFAIGGPYIGTGLSGTVENLRTGEKRDLEFNMGGIRVRRLDFGLIGGAGLTKPFRWGEFFLDIRYSYGLFEVSGHRNITNNGIIFLIGQSFKL